MTVSTSRERRLLSHRLRRGSERFHSRLDWLDSFHTFSFSHHYDPAWTGFGPLLVINDDTIAPRRGFGMHPHRDMEIITVMVEGELTHRDSMGNGEVLRAGEVQRMSAGTGIVHSEMNAGSQPCRLLQIWILPEGNGSPPSYEQRPFQVGGGWTPLLDPDGTDGAMAIQRPVRLWRARPTAGVQLPVQLRPDRLGWIQMIDGSVIAAPSPAEEDGTPLPLQRGDGLGWADPTALTLTASDGGADLLLFELG